MLINSPRCPQDILAPLAPLLHFVPSLFSGARHRSTLLGLHGHNLLMFGPPGVGETHLAAALGRTLLEQGYRVLFTRMTDLVQRMQTARQELNLPGALEKLDKFDLLILDDLSYVEKDQAETSVLFELISTRYERRSMLVTANQPFGQWDRIFPDPAMTVAAIDRLVHHSVIFEMNVESYHRRTRLNEPHDPAKRCPPTQRSDDRAHRGTGQGN